MLNKLFSAFVCTILATTALWGQTTAGQITGTVVDSTGAAVPKTHVIATSLETGATQTALSNEEGIYRLSALPVGTYKVTAEREGFRPFLVDKLILSTASTLRVDVALSPATVTEAVEVQAVSPLLITETASNSQLVNNVNVQNLPLQLNGKFRDPTTLAALTPGYTGSNIWPTAVPAVSGGRGYSEEILLDGAPNMGYTNSLTISAVVPALDTIGEFKVITSLLPAEYGRSDAGMITMVSKSGTRELHGAVADLIRNDSFDARPYFAKLRNRVRQQEFGAQLGGPVYLPKFYKNRERTFFFFDYNGFRLSVRNGGQFRTVPTDAMRGGDFSAWPSPIYDPLTNTPDGNGGVTRQPYPGNRIPAGSLDPLALKLQALFPHANLPGVANNFNGTQIMSEAVNAYFIKIDHYITTSNRLVFSVRVKTDLTENQGILGRVIDGSGYPPPFKTSNWILTDDHIFSPTLLNHFSFGYSRVRFIQQPSTGQDVGVQVPGTFGVGMPGLIFSNGYGVPNAPASQTSFRMEGHNNFDWQDNLSLFRGKHSFKWGIRISRNGLNERPSVTNGPGLPCWDCPGNYMFSSLGTGLPDASNRSLSGNPWASFLLGFVDQGTANRYPARGWRNHYFALFFQDDYKLTPRLTINYGLRWDFTPPFSEVEGRVVDINLGQANPTVGGLAGSTDYFGSGAGRVGRTNLSDSYWKEFGPRLGLAYQLNKDTMLRAGGGIVWAPQSLIDNIRFPLKNGFDNLAFAFTNNTSITPAFWLSQGFNPSQVTTGVGFGGVPNPGFLNGHNGLYFDSGMPGVHYQYTAAIQRMLPGRVSIDAAYVGTIGKHLAWATLVHPNQLPTKYLALGNLLNQNVYSPQTAAAGIQAPYAGFQGTVAQALRPYPQYLDVYNPTAPAGNSTYHAFQLKVQKNYANGLQFSTAYSLSKTITDVDLYQFDSIYALAARDQYNRKLEKGLSAYDTPQRLVNAVVYELPVGPGKRFLSYGGVRGRMIGGWSISTIMTYQSGFPLSLFAPNTLGIFSGLQTDNIVPGQALTLKADRASFNPATDRYLNPTAFTVPPAFTLGTLGRVLPNLRAFGTRNEDFNLIKRIAIKEQIHAELTFSLFNAFNRHGLGAPTTDITSPAFGTITAAQNPRTGQIGAKIVW